MMILDECNILDVRCIVSNKRLRMSIRGDKKLYDNMRKYNEFVYKNEYYNLYIFVTDFIEEGLINFQLDWHIELVYDTEKNQRVKREVKLNQLI